MPERPAEAILVSVATAAALAVRYSPILSELVTTEAKIRILNTSKSIAGLLAGMQTPFRGHLELREVFFHVAVRLLILVTALISWQEKTLKRSD